MSAAQELQNRAIAQAETYANELKVFTQTLGDFANVSTGPRSSDGSRGYANWGSLLPYVGSMGDNGGAVDGLTTLAAKVPLDLPAMAVPPDTPNVVVPNVTGGAPQSPIGQLSKVKIADKPPLWDKFPMSALDNADMAFGDAPTITPIVPPTRIDVALPTAPVLIDTPIPTVDNLVLPTFNAVAPATDSIHLDIKNFEFSEKEYSSEIFGELLAKAREKLDDPLAGAGSDEIKAEYEKLTLVHKEAEAVALEDAMNDAAALGFMFPPGAAANRITKIRQAAVSGVTKGVADVLMKRTEMILAERKVAYEQLERLEQHVLKRHVETVARAFEVARFMADFGVKLFEARIARFNALSAAFRDALAKYGAEVQAGVSRLEAQKVRVQAAGLATEVQRNRVQVYTAQLESMKLAADIYATDVKASQGLMEIERLKIEAFRAQVEAFGERVKMNRGRVETYTAAVQASNMGVERAKLESDIQKTEVEFAKTQADVVESNARITAEQTRLQIAAAQANAQIYSAKAQGVAASNDAWARAYAARTEAYRAMASVYESAGRLGIAQYDSTSRVALGNLQAAVEQQRGVWEVRTKSTTAGAEVLSRAMQSALNQVVSIAQTSA